MSVTNEELGKIVKLKELNYKPYVDFIKELEDEVPLEREMITPIDLSKAKQLTKVFSRGGL